MPSTVIDPELGLSLVNTFPLHIRMLRFDCTGLIAGTKSFCELVRAEALPCLGGTVTACPSSYNCNTSSLSMFPEPWGVSVIRKIWKDSLMLCPFNIIIILSYFLGPVKVCSIFSCAKIVIPEGERFCF